LPGIGEGVWALAEFRVGFCVSGGGRLARAAISRAAQLGVTPALLLADHRASTDLEAFCDQHAVPMIRLAQMPRSEFDDHVTAACIKAKLDLLALTFEWLVRPRLIQHYAGRIINVHPALLPAFPGMDSLARGVNSGSRYVGASIHEVDEGIDTGPVISQCVIGLRSEDTPALVGARMFNLMRMMFLQVIGWYAEGRVHKDKSGQVVIADATYGEFPISPSVEIGFVD
jgi:phosphoribosylglycinamide formyltransferase-1